MANPVAISAASKHGTMAALPWLSIIIALVVYYCFVSFFKRRGKEECMSYVFASAIMVPLIVVLFVVYYVLTKHNVI